MAEAQFPDETGAAESGLTVDGGPGANPPEPRSERQDAGSHGSRPASNLLDGSEAGRGVRPPGGAGAAASVANDNLGLPTFSGRDWVATASGLAARQPDVAVVGAPFDISTTHRAGARFGPRSIRSAAYDPGSYHLDLGLDIFEWLDVVDGGDAWCPHGQTERSHENIGNKVTDVLAAGAFPVIIGGDHSITWPAATAVARKFGWGKLGLLHFDAHADTADSIEGNLASHGRRCVG